MFLPGTYKSGFAPRDGQPRFAELWRGCVGAWAPCLGPTGSVLRDQSGRCNHGTLTSMDAATDWVADQGAWALDFDGSDDLVSIANSTALDITSAWAVSLWCKPATAGEQGYLIAKNSTGAVSDGYYVYWDGVADAVSAIGTAAATTQAVFVDIVWTHVAVSVTAGGAALFYRNGIQVGSSGILGVPTSNSTPLLIGARSGGNSAARNFAGCIDDVRVYNRELKHREVLRLASCRGIAYELDHYAQLRLSSNGRRRRILTGVT